MEYLKYFKSDVKCSNTGVCKYRIKTVKSGKILECEIYPIYSRSYLRGAKLEHTKEAQQRLAVKNRRKKIIRLINTNFDKSDLWVTLTYDRGHNPGTIEEAQKNIRNYLRKIKYRDPDVKFLYVTEGKEKNKRFHHHIVMATKLTRNQIEDLWTGGARKEAHRLQPDEAHLTGLGIYMTKSITSKSEWGKSRNLKQPKETVADTRLTRRKALRMAENENACREILENIYKKYKCLNFIKNTSEIISGVYIRALMRRRD